MAAPISTASDTGGQEASSFSGGSMETPSAPAEQQQTQPQSENIDTGSDAAAEEPASQFSEEEFRDAPQEWREKFGSLLSGYKSLEKDLRDMRRSTEMYQPLEEFGGVETVMQQLQTLQGLGAYKTDEHGALVRDANGFPVVTTSPFLQSLQQQENGAYLTDQLAYDLWSQARPDGQTYGAWYMQQLGLDPARLQEYQSLAAQSQVSTGEWTQDEVDIIQGQFGEDRLTKAYQSLTSAEREAVQDMLYDSKDAQARQILEREAGRLDNEARIQQIEQAQKQEQEHALNSFWQGVNQSLVEEVGRTNREAIAALTKQISSQVTFSSDPTTNQIQNGAVGALVAAMCSEQTRFAMEPVLQALGVQYDAQLDGLFQQQMEATQRYLTLKAAADNPRFAAYRNDGEMAKAKAAADGCRQRALAKLAPVAAKIARAIAGQNQEQRDQRNSALQAANGRPTIGNGAIAQNGKQIPKTADPFTMDFLRAIS